MKKRPLKLRLPYFFGQRNPSTDSSDNMPDLIKPESVWERVESGIEDILRWADDGGKMLDLGNGTTRLTPDTAQKQRKKDEDQQNRKVSGSRD
jgi:hypothetical protein